MAFGSSWSAARSFIPETAFGKWFLGTETWRIHVVERAIADLERLITNRRRAYPIVLDVGCGRGLSFQLLGDTFIPDRIVGVDICPEMIAAATAHVNLNNLPVTLFCADCASLPLPDCSVDLLFCHQTFHHLIAQHDALGEFYRVLRPGGLLLFAESTRHYIHSWIIRLLFRHPMDVQREAAEYIDMIHLAGFHVDFGAASYPFLWWSRPDFGLLERIFGVNPASDHPETLVNLVAIRT